MRIESAGIARLARIPEPLSADDPIVQLKLAVLEAAMPAEHAIVFGDVWGVNGAYSECCLELGCNGVVVIDSLETEEFLKRRLAHPEMHFFRGDFSNPYFMLSLMGAFEIGVAFDVLLHQATLLTTLHLMLHRTNRAICIAQPVLVEQELPNSLVYLPGNEAEEALRPSYKGIEGGGEEVIHAFDVDHVHHGFWLWGMTRSLIENVLKGEGFEISFEQRGPDLANPNWYLWGCVAERKRVNPVHWSASHPYPTRDPL